MSCGRSARTLCTMRRPDASSFYMRLGATAFLILLAPAVAASSPRDVVDAFHGALVATMRANVDYEHRVQRLAPAIDAAFDVETIAKVSLGATWRELDASARTEFVALLRDLIVSTYADRFVRDKGQSFETLAEETPRPGRAIVRTRLVRADGAPVLLDYYLTGERIYDIVADGVSDLSLRRADYAAIVTRKGFAGLLEEIRATVETHRRAEHAT